MIVVCVNSDGAVLSADTKTQSTGNAPKRRFGDKIVQVGNTAAVAAAGFGELSLTEPDGRVVFSYSLKRFVALATRGLHDPSPQQVADALVAAEKIVFAKFPTERLTERISFRYLIGGIGAAGIPDAWKVTIVIEPPTPPIAIEDHIPRDSETYKCEPIGNQFATLVALSRPSLSELADMSAIAIMAEASRNPNVKPPIRNIILRPGRRPARATWQAGSAAP